MSLVSFEMYQRDITKFLHIDISWNTTIKHSTDWYIGWPVPVDKNLGPTTEAQCDKKLLFEHVGGGTLFFPFHMNLTRHLNANYFFFRGANQSFFPFRLTCRRSGVHIREIQHGTQGELLIGYRDQSLECPPLDWLFFPIFIFICQASFYPFGRVDQCSVGNMLMSKTLSLSSLLKVRGWLRRIESLPTEGSGFFFLSQWIIIPFILKAF